MPQAGSQIVKSAFARGSGFMQRTIGLDQQARREVLAGPFLPSLAAFSSRPSKASAFTSTPSVGPLGLVDQADEPLQVDRVVEPRLRPGVDVAEDAGLLARASRRTSM